MHSSVFLFSGRIAHRDFLLVENLLGNGLLMYIIGNPKIIKKKRFLKVDERARSDCGNRFVVLLPSRFAAEDSRKQIRTAIDLRIW